MNSDISNWIKEAEKKQRILDLLLPVLREVKGLETLEYNPGEETVTAAFTGGREKKINIAGDSDIAMIFDVIIRLW